MVLRKRLDLAGPAVAFITTTVFEWKPVLTKRNVINTIIAGIQNTQSLFRCSIVSYVIMPSHIHLLMGLPKIEHLSKCMQGFKSVTSRKIRQLTLEELAQNDFRLWKPRFDDVIVQSEKQLRIKTDYIHNNPVKAGLVKKAEDWPYSSAVDLLTPNRSMIEVDKEFHWLTRS